MNQRGLVGILILIVLIVIGVGTGGYYLGIKNRPSNIQVISNSTPTPTTNPTSNWLTYKSTGGNYEFKYPSDWYTYPTSGSSICVLFGTKSEMEDYQVKGNQESWSLNSCYLTSNIPNEFPYRVSPINGRVLQKENSTIQRTEVNGYSLVRGQHENPADFLKNFADVSDGKNRYIQIESHPEDKEILNMILTTFKFTR